MNLAPLKSGNRLAKRIVVLIGVASLCIYFLVLGVLSFHFYRLEQSKYSLLSDQISLAVKSQVMAKDEIGIRLMLSKILDANYLLGIKVNVDGMDEVSDFKKGDDIGPAYESDFKSLLTSRFLGFARNYPIYPGGEERYQISFVYENTSRREIFTSSLLVTLIIFVITSFVIFKSRLSIDQEMLRRSVDEEKSNLAAKIFHLIRSDIIQLNGIIDKYRGSIDKEDRILVRNTTTTILGTAGRFIKGNQKIYNTLDRQEIFLLSDLVSELIKKKRLEYQNRPEVELHLEDDARFISVKSISSDIQLALSNIVNNSFEAIQGSGSVTFKISENGNLATITIEDTGPGVPRSKLSDIIKDGYSYKKEQGNGLGLSQAFEIVNSLGGEILIDSDLDKGMKTTICLLSEGRAKDRYTQDDISRFEYVLIEDSRVRRVNFEKEASVQNIRVGTFSGFREFKDYLGRYQFDKKVTIYTDSDLGEEVPGEVSAKELFYKYGFRKIKLLTAADTDQLKEQKMDWISEIVGKHEDFKFFGEVVV